ncbi:hypothetical protein QBC34DRAFT_439427 [Podospora aff. communis PSN243]|uniref:Uncharacterized protein n=1 Tax=Podospora aff. communis PSN243 TaxID=3040156 RepID=A0AAV9GL50_9PEZI|nr:hypothetical protein QBC34DRAFT_439427 [Podospora aff. communis PSN243]
MSNYTAPAAPTATPEAPPLVPQTGPQGTGPYLPQTAQLGGIPTTNLDVPICAVFLALFVGGAAANMTIFQINRKHGYKFLFSGLLFGFCMARIVALSMRIVWSAYPRDVNVGIAAQIFTAAGVLLLFITNLVFAQRIIRAYHPFFGWNRGVTMMFRGLFGSIVAVLIMTITVTVQSFFTLDPDTRRIDRDIQLFSATYLAVLATLPIPLVTLAAIIPRRTRIDKFGEGHFRTKFALLIFTTTLLAAGAIFRAAIAYNPRPIQDPAWYQSKACYYFFNFGIEIIVVYTYALSRFDRRFHVPDGSSAPGHYSCAEFGESAAAIAAAVAEFEKGGPSSYTTRKRSSAVSGKVGLGISRHSYGAGRIIKGSSPMPAMPAKIHTPDQRSIKSQGRSSKSVYRDAPDQTRDPSREADMEWMARAMRELYGDEDYAGSRHSCQH